MREIVLPLHSSICEPESVSSASDLVVFLDGERYRDRVGALAVIEALRAKSLTRGLSSYRKRVRKPVGASAHATRRLPDVLARSY